MLFLLSCKTSIWLFLRFLLINLLTNWIILVIVEHNTEGLHLATLALVAYELAISIFEDSS